jgi:heat shock protein HslJ
MSAPAWWRQPRACQPMHHPVRWARKLCGALALAACALASGLAAQPVTPSSGAAGANSVVDLVAHRWRLTSATNQQGQAISALSRSAGTPVELWFSDGRIEIRGGCNVRGGDYRIATPGQLIVGRMATTTMSCEPPLMQVDAVLSAYFATPVRFEVSAGASPRLQLVSGNGEKLEFSGRLTPEARYGAAVIAFLEVAPRKVPCQHPLRAGARCLQVRELRFDEKGLRVGSPGPWQLLSEDIDGFRHLEGERSVLRVKRFTRSPVPADASATLYVLDLVVESGTVPR